MDSPVKIVLGTGFADIPSPHDKAANIWIGKDLDFYRDLMTRDPRWRFILTGEDIQNTLSDPNAKGILFHIEGLNAIESEVELDMLDNWYLRGLRSIGIVWMVTNPLGGGTGDPIQGLTDLGKKVLMWCERKGVVVDLAHMNRPTFWDTMKVISKPPFVSHTASDALFASPRNLTDEQINEVAKRNGIVGVFVAKGSIVGKEWSIDYLLTHVLDHIEHVVDIGGHKHVALGTDYGGILSGVPKDMSAVTDLPVLIEGLRARGWTEENLKNLLYENASRVLSAHLTPLR
jgi:membrane dipeptidase